MKVIELTRRLKSCDSNAEIFVQIDRTSFVSPTWIRVMDTAGLFAEEQEFRLVISVGAGRKA